ncbi:MAG: hypothetical protein ACE5LU_03365 [Anaerolineae bacterium]
MVDHSQKIGTLEDEMYLFGTEHIGVRNLLRRLRIRPYVIFPTPEPDTLAVYFHDQQGPAIILVRYLRTWRWGWWGLEPPTKEEREKRIAEEEEQVTRFRQTGEELVQRLECPVACVHLITGYVRYKAAFSDFLRWAREQGVASIDLAGWRPPTLDLIWIQPATRAASIPLPPFADQTRWRASIDPAWWQAQLPVLADPDDHQRKKSARSLAGDALDFLKEAPARVLVEGPAALAAPHAMLPDLPACMDRPAGRRYLIWTGVYLAGACMADPAWEEHSEPVVLGYLNFLLSQMGAWSNREQRVVLRGLQMLAQKSVDHDLPQRAAIAQFFRDLFVRLMHDDFLAMPTHSWRWKSHLTELAEILARCGYVAHTAWKQQWQQHKLRTEMLDNTYRGLLERLVWSADPETHRAVVSAEYELREKVKSRLGWHLYDNDFSPAFWELVAQEDWLLTNLAEAAVKEQSSPDFPPSDEALQRLISLIEQRLQGPDLPAWTRSRLEQALSHLLPEEESSSPVLE